MDGLFRFDGYTFRNINTIVKDTFNIKANCIIEDQQGNFWIGTSGKGLYYYHTRNERLYSLKLSQGNQTNIFQILFFQDKIWIASNIGLLVINQSSINTDNQVSTQLLLPNPLNKMAQENYINTLFGIEGTNTLWVGSDIPLYALDTQTLKFSKINSSDHTSIRSMTNYNNKMIVVACYESGIFLIDPETEKLIYNEFIVYVNTILGHVRINDIYYDNAGRFWVATYGEGLYLFKDNASGNFSFQQYKNDRTKESLKSDLINSMYIDNSGIVWLCMNQPALTKLYFQNKNIQTYYLDKENLANEILTFNPSFDRHKLWVSTINKGIYLFNMNDHTSIQYNTSNESILKLKSNSISNCYQDRKGNLWIVDRLAGLFILPAKNAITLTIGENAVAIKPIDANKLLLNGNDGHYITKFYEDSDGRIWISAWETIYLIELKEGFSKANNINDLTSNSHVLCVYSKAKISDANFPVVPVRLVLESKKGQYFIATSDLGIIQIDEKSSYIFSFKLWDYNNKLPGSIINCMYKDKNQGIWIGTNSGLLYYSQNKGIVKTFDLGFGVADESVNNIIEDDKSNIWVSFSYGISKINPENFSVKNFFHTDKENLNKYIPNVVALASRGMIYFTSKGNLEAIDPNADQIEEDIPPLYFTDIKIDNQKVIPNEIYGGTKVIESNINECKTINVPYNHTLNIEFAALDFKTSEQQFYKYKVGDKKEWVILNSNQRSLILPAMSPGEYTLEIMLTNNTKVERIRRVNINYLPPFWRSKPAYVAYFIILILLFLVYRRLTIQKIQRDTIIEKERYEKKKLMELDAMKSEFFSNISHELRTPLSLIINPLEEYTLKSNIPAEHKEKLNIVLKSSQRLLRLTNELLDFSKIEKKLLVPQFNLIEIVSYINNICVHYQNLADSMNIDFKQNCPFEQLNIPIDTKMIEKIVFNLLSNAFKYTPENGVILVNLSQVNLNNIEYLKISVINTGEGIKKDAIGKIFDKFYQVNNLQNRKVEGTGIGLALVKNYVEMHNGLVEVKSEPNMETCFDVYLPIFQLNYLVDNEKTTTDFSEISNLEQSFSEAKINKSSSNYSLLIVEDDDELMNYLAKELSNDFKIITAINGEEGLKKANEIIPDIIITDIVMPVFSGIELCRALRSQVLTSHIPLVLLSARTDINQQIEGLETGADVYITKPFNIFYLRTQIIRLINFKEIIYQRYLKENTLVPHESINSELDKEFIQKVISFIEENITDPHLNIEQLARHVCLSHAQTYRKIKAISGMPIVKFIRTARLKKAAHLVVDKKLNFTEIAYETGFSSLSYFTQCFREHFGKSPTEFVSGFDKNS
jgi:signal transduction histidine kinase/ligand-binding sensor domain-containing protein/CheY-like chemotaxis protein/AraC-like DNA-binding protein